MSWIHSLYETYNANLSRIGDPQDAVPLLPLCHTIQNAQIEIAIDMGGNFLRANLIPKEFAPTIIPCTESSCTRAGKMPKGHPLCDNLQYLAGDFADYGGTVTSGFKKNPKYPFEEYLKNLTEWCDSSFSDKKIQAVLKYVEKRKIIMDLVKDAKLLFVNQEQQLIAPMTKPHLVEIFVASENLPAIFNVIQPDQADKTIDQSGAFVRWHVETPGDPRSDISKDPDVWQSWINFYVSKESEVGWCYALGTQTIIGKSHPKRLRRSNDNAKLISIPSDKGLLTFQGRFTDQEGEQAVGLSFEASQKSHSALRWLIGRKQAFKNGDQVIVAWEVAGKEIPDLFSNSFDLFADKIEDEPQETYKGDSGQLFAQQLKRYIAGYSTKLGTTKNIIVLGLDSATPGRLSITYYRELTGSEFLTRIESWHSEFAWQQRINIDNPEKKNKQIVLYPICAPSPIHIAQGAYGQRLDDKLKKSTIERLLPCIIDGLAIPIDLVNSSVKRASNRIGLEHWEWEKTLGIACSLYKGFYLRNPQEKRSYSMALEPERITRDYLYGRLLAAADLLENVALHITEKNRPTTAARLMQRFAERPFSTWRTIELALSSYRARLKGRTKYDTAITDIISLFEHDDFTSDKPLTGEFLLGYHCQREALKKVLEKKDEEEILQETK